MSKLVKFFAAGVFVLANIGLGATAFAATPDAASSSTTPSQLHAKLAANCEVHYVCVFEAANFGGAQASKSGYTEYKDLPGSMWDRTSSWVNANNSRHERLYDWGAGSTDLIIIDTLPDNTAANYVGDGANDRANALGWD